MLKNEFSIDQQEDEDLRCPICNYYFSEITKPFLLPCNHNLCMKCIDCVVDKKMLNCPICRKSFKEEDKKNFQVNFAFLNLVLKILKTKVIFCKKCSRIFNWVDHYSACDQRDFLETNEMLEQIKKLAEESYAILKSIDKHSNVLVRSKSSIFESTQDILKIINLNFFENFEKTVQHFFSNVPVLNYSTYVGELKKFLKLCRTLDSKFNISFDEVIDHTEDSEDCQISDEELDLMHTNSNNRKRDGYVSLNRDTPNLSLSVNRFHSQSHSTKKYKSINSSFLDLNENFSTKNKTGDMLVNNFRQSRQIISTIMSNPMRKFSVDNNYLMRGIMRRNMTIKEEDEEGDNLSLICGDRLNRKNSSIDEMKERNPIKVDYFGKTNFTKSNNLNSKNDGDRKECNTKHMDNDYNDNFSNDDERYFGRNTEFVHDEDEDESFKKNKFFNFKEDLDLIRNSQRIDNTRKVFSRMNRNDVNSTKNKQGVGNCKDINSSNNKILIGEENMLNVRIPSPNTNIMNLNYNFNLNQIFNNNEGMSDKNKSCAKKKIIVKNNEVKIVNVNCNLITDSQREESNNDIKNNKDDNQRLFIDVSKSSEFIYSNKEKLNKNFNNLYFENSNKIRQSGITGNSAVKTNKKEFVSTKYNRKNITPTTQSPHETINNILVEFNKSRDIVDKILNYTKQVEFTTETIQNQISTNFNNLQDNITKNINSLCDNITVGFSQTNKKYMINFLENTKKIWVFDVRKMKPELKEFDFLKNKFNSSMSMDFDDSDLIFISGGKVYSSSLFESDYTFTNNFIILRWSTRTVEQNGQMPRKRAFHSSVTFDGKYFVIGGLSITIIPNQSNSQSSQVVNVRECECYDRLEKRWELMPCMNAARCNPSLCIYNGTYLYVFRGWVNSNSNECNFIDTIEFININNFTLGWTMFRPEDPGMCWTPSSNSAATVIGENKILICGGISNYNNNSKGNNSYGNNSCATQENKFLNQSFIFDPIRKTVYRSIDMIKACSFNSVGTVYEKNMIVIDNKNEIGKPFGAHVYDIDNNMWKFNLV